MRSEMEGKGLVFVTGHRRPTVAPLAAKYVRHHPDGSPMLAESTSDTIEAAEARHQAALATEKAKAKKPKEGDGDGA